MTARQELNALFEAKFEAEGKVTVLEDEVDALRRALLDTKVRTSVARFLSERVLTLIADHRYTCQSHAGGGQRGGGQRGRRGGGGGAPAGAGAEGGGVQRRARGVLPVRAFCMDACDGVGGWC